MPAPGSALRFCASVWILLAAVIPAWPQQAASVDSAGTVGVSGSAGQSLPETGVSTSSAYIGMKVDELFARFGPPRSVYASRGQEMWQDDVVFVYDSGDFYIFKDRVWQAGFKSAYGIRVGDTKPAVVLALGEAVTDQGDYILYPLPPAGWPLTLRVHFTAAGRVSAIYIYRPDF